MKNLLKTNKKNTYKYSNHYKICKFNYKMKKIKI